MGIHIEGQTKEDVKNIRSRELQLENTEKLDNIIPVIDVLEEIDLKQIEEHTSEIKDIVQENLESQPNIEDIMAQFDDVSQEINNMKKSMTQLKKTATETKKLMAEMNKKLEG